MKDKNLDANQRKDAKRLINSALSKLPNAYAPYSRFKVACAIKSEGGRIFNGVNVENPSFGISLCAERSALAAMITELGRKARVYSLAVISNTSKPCYPCGACRQALLPFSNEDTLLYLMAKRGEILVIRFLDLLPDPFEL